MRARQGRRACALRSSRQRARARPGQGHLHDQPGSGAGPNGARQSDPQSRHSTGNGPRYDEHRRERSVQAGNVRQPGTDRERHARRHHAPESTPARSEQITVTLRGLELGRPRRRSTAASTAQPGDRSADHARDVHRRLRGPVPISTTQEPSATAPRRQPMRRRRPVRLRRRNRRLATRLAQQRATTTLWAPGNTTAPPTMADRLTPATRG